MRCLGQWFSAALSRDMCPRAGEWVRRLEHPTVVLACCLVSSLALAAWVSPLAIVSFIAILSVLVLGYAWPTLSIRGLSARVEFREPRVREGQVLQATVAIRNAWPWPVWGIAVEGDVGGEVSVALAQVAGWSTTEFVWDIIAGHRGEYPRTPWRIVNGFPFGLRLAHRDVVVDKPVLVWPATIELDTLVDAAETRPADDMFSEIRIGDSGDMAGTRPFRHGDSLRRVHWAQTARLGEMVVCERESPVLSAVRVVFDSNPAVHDGDVKSGSLETSIRIAASICLAYHRHNAHVECCFGHESLRLATGAAGLRRFLDELARFVPCTHHSHSCQHEHSPAACRRIHHHNCGVFQVTITTSRGLCERTEHRHVHGDQLWVVMASAGDDDAGCLTLPGKGIWLDVAERSLEAFEHRWRALCHAG